VAGAGDALAADFNPLIYGGSIGNQKRIWKSDLAFSVVFLSATID
jgi:hypothetical protein